MTSANPDRTAMIELNADQRRQFVLDNRVCLYGYNRKADGPSMSLCYYTMDEDDILILTMAARAKAKAAKRSQKASVCVLDMKLPPTYLLVYGDVAIENDLQLATDVCARLMGFEMEYETGEPFAQTQEQLVKLRELMELEDRLVIRVTPYETFYSPATRGQSLDELIAFRRNLQGNPIQVGQMLPWR